MAAFETKVGSSSEDESGRSRSDRVIGGSTAKIALVSSSDTSMSTPEVSKKGAMPSGTTHKVTVSSSAAALPLGTGSMQQQSVEDGDPSAIHSPDGTLSQFLHESPTNMIQTIPQNPFARSSTDPSSTGPVGNASGNPTVVHHHQTNVKYESNQTNTTNELHVSMDPFIIAQANQALEQSKATILSQAKMAVDQSRIRLREEAKEVVTQIQEAVKSEAMNAIDNANQAQETMRQEAMTAISHAQSSASKVVEEAQSEVSQITKRAHDEIDMVKKQAATEVARVKSDAQVAIAKLEGRISELTRENNQMRVEAKRMLEERDGTIYSLVQRVNEQDTLIKDLQSTNSKLKETAMRSHVEPDNGTEFKIHTPTGYRSASQGLFPDVVPFDLFEGMPDRVNEPFAVPQDPKSQLTSAKPSGSTGRVTKDGSKSKRVQKDNDERNQPVHAMISELKSTLANLEQRVSRSPSAKDPSEGKGSSSSSSSQPRGGGGSPGGSSPGSGNEERSSKSSGSDDDDPYRREKRLMRVKGYDSLKIASIPKNAAECRGFKNQVISAICKLCKGDESPLVEWIQRCAVAKNATEFQNVGNYPLLDRTLGHKLLENARGSKFSLDFQALQERCQKVGKQPSGRALLWFILNKYSLDKDRGASLSQHHLLSLKLSGKDVKSLEDFRQKMLYIMGSLEQSEMPQESALRSMLYENVKHHPLMALAIDKYRSAREGSSKRTSKWLMEKIDETIELAQQDENTTFVEKALKTTGGNDKNPAAAPAKADKPDKKPDKDPKDKLKKDSKPKKEKKEDPKRDDSKGQGGTSSSAAVNAAPGPSKGGGKGKKGATNNAEKPKLTKEEKSKLPCMYYAFDSCTKGDKCPYLHDKNNMYKGPKPKPLTKSTPAGSAKVSAGAATVVASIAASESVVGAGASSLSAPHQHSEFEEDGSSVARVCKKLWKRVSGGHGSIKVRRHAKPVKRDNGCKAFPNPMMFEKAIKCFAAIAAVCTPSGFHQEFLVDSGAGRNLISTKDMPVQWNDFVADAPEQLKFATGGGVRPSSKAIKLKGDLTGEGIFYTLKDCPAALSLGQQVNEQGKAWVWFPNQLPFFIQSHRLADVTFHCPENARIYVDRVEQNVPILAEVVECLAMPADPTGPSSSSSHSGAKPSPAPLVTSGVEGEGGERLHLEGKDDEALSEGYSPTTPIDSPRDLVLPEGPPDDPHSSEDDGEEAAKAFNHSLTHYPKSKHCEICKRAKMTSRYHRRRGDPDEEETPPLHFGHMFRVDHIIMGSDLSKGSEGEKACLICYDEFSGCYQAFSQTARSIENNVNCLRKFGGTKGHGKALCSVKSDSAQELTEAVKQLGWLPEPGLPNDPFHNSKLESNIRRIKEGTRAVHLAAGFPHELWPRSIEYFCIARAFTTFAPIHPNETDDAKRLKQGWTCYEAANNGEPFEGLKLPLGVLIYYKPAMHKEKPAFEPRTMPGIFAGWRMDSGFKHRKVHLILDYESLRLKSKGFGRPLQIHASEIVVPDEFIFPLFRAEQSKLEGGSGELPKIALPFDEGAPPTPGRSRRTYVTLERVIRFGKTLGCKGCDHIAEGNAKHLHACHERFRALLEKERLENAKKAEEAVVIEAPPPVDDAESLEREFDALLEEASKEPATHAMPSKVQDDQKLNDYWEFDHEKGAWCKVHLRPRKRLFAPVGNDCPFNASEIGSKRQTEWRCKKAVSLYTDDWQAKPYQRISSKSWTGRTWFFPSNMVNPKCAEIHAAIANVKQEQKDSKRVVVRTADHVIASLCEEYPNDASEIVNLAASVARAKLTRSKVARSKSNRLMFEFCCSDDSMLGKVNEERDIPHIRLTEKNSNMADPDEIDSLLKVQELFPGHDLWGSIPCGPWSPWQNMSLARYGKGYKKKLEQKRKKSMKLLNNFIRCAEKTLELGGHVSFEWPKQSEGWKIPKLLEFIKKHNLFVAEPEGCALGLVDSNGEPHLKKWRVVTSSYLVARNLDVYKCTHGHDFKHSQLEGSKTPKSAFYPEPMCQCISNSLYPSETVAMPVIPKAGVSSLGAPHQHVHAMTAQSSKSDHEENLRDPQDVYAGIHMLIDRKDWHKYPGSKEAIDKEASGILENGTWTYDEVVPKSELRKRKEPMHVGRLMVILSMKHFETPELRKLKARIVFRGDDIRDQDNNLAVLQEAKVNPTGIAGINANLAFGALRGHSTSQSDVVRAYIQSYLNTKVPTWVQLPPELVPDKFKHIKDPCVRLYRSLYGHPESGYHWDQRFKAIMKELKAEHLADFFQSTYFIKEKQLLITLYVDDVVLSGPTKNHKWFWDELQKHIEIDPPSPVDRVLGRKHLIKRDNQGTSLRMDMADFAQNACRTYEELSGCVLKGAATPYLPEGSLVDSDFEARGEMSGDASKILMKILWSARLCRPDLMKSISDLTRRITKWSKGDDRKLYRLMCYLKQTANFHLEGHINDDASSLRLCLYTDADHASGSQDTKSTSGMYLTLEGPNSFWPLCWGSKRQGATARSTCEAEMISLDSGAFGEGVPMQELFSLILDRPVELQCLQDNASVIQIVHNGYSPKLRHMKKIHKLNLASLYELFTEPDIKLQYIKTSLQRADPYTKALEPCKWKDALELLNVIPPELDSKT